MSFERGGMPLLSGPPPPLDSPRADSSCRKCNKEFNVIFTRARKCNHCGLSYCSTCSDYTALMPRPGMESGYDPVPVCAFCIENLNITAGGRVYLRSLPLARLRRYVDAYNIKIPGALEKDDLVNTIIAARGRNGCLPPAQEDYYRKHSVPNGRSGRPRGLFSHRQPPPPAQPPRRPATPIRIFARPDLETDAPSTQSSPSLRQQMPGSYGPSTQRPRPYSPPSRAPPQPRTYPTYSPPPRPRTAQANPLRTVDPRTSSARTASNAPPPAPTPSLDELLAMADEVLGALSVSTLKAVLFDNHVNARLLLEKSELVERVRTLVEDERQERAREAAVHAREDAEIIAQQHAMMEQQRTVIEEHRARREGAHASPAGVSTDSLDAPAGVQGSVSSFDEKSSSSSLHSAPAAAAIPALERNGLCVICQDEEANIAIVDCGHMAMCRNCSDLVMSSSRECPLCRTRIVTEARLLRIFKT